MILSNSQHSLWTSRNTPGRQYKQLAENEWNEPDPAWGWQVERQL